MAMTEEVINRTATGLHEGLVGSQTNLVTRLKESLDRSDDSFFATLAGEMIMGITIRGNGTDEFESSPLTARELVDLLRLSSPTMEADDYDAQSVAAQLDALIAA